MDTKELLGKELSNLYAITKQVNHFFDGNDISFLTESRQHTVMKYVKLSCKNEQDVAEVLRTININPGNTTDSIINEITENLHDITIQKDSTDELKSMGYIMSFNRLISYHEANIKNIEYLLDEIGDLRIN